MLQVNQSPRRPAVTPIWSCSKTMSFLTMSVSEAISNLLLPKSLLLTLFPHKKSLSWLSFMLVPSPFKHILYSLASTTKMVTATLKSSAISCPFLCLSTLFLWHCHPVALFKIHKSHLMWWKWSVTWGSCPVSPSPIYHQVHKKGQPSPTPKTASNHALWVTSLFRFSYVSSFSWSFPDLQHCRHHHCWALL